MEQDPVCRVTSGDQVTATLQAVPDTVQHPQASEGSEASDPQQADRMLPQADRRAIRLHSIQISLKET